MRAALDRQTKSQYLNHAADQLDKGGGVVVGSLLVEDHVAGHAGPVVQNIVVAVEDMLSVPHEEGNYAAQGPDIRSSRVSLKVPEHLWSNVGGTGLTFNSHLRNFVLHIREGRVPIVSSERPGPSQVPAAPVDFLVNYWLSEGTLHMFAISGCSQCGDVRYPPSW